MDRRRDEAERARQEAEGAIRWLEAALDAAPVGLIIAEAPSGRIRVTNAEMDRIARGHTPASRSMHDYFGDWVAYHPDGRRLAPADYPLTRALTTARRTPPEEYRFRRQDGTDVWVRVSAAPVATPSGEVVGGVLAVVDIDAEKTAAAQRESAEAALRESEERLRLAAEATGFGSYDFDLSSGKVVWTPQLRAITQLPGEGPVTQEDVARQVHPDDRERFARLVSGALEPDGPGRHEAEFRVIRMDGAVRWVRDTGQTYFEGEGDARRAVRVVGTVQDITERKQAEQALAESNRRKDEFLAMLGHELRNPLAAIRNATELVRMVASEDDDLRSAQGVLERQSAHMTRLIEGLLEVSRIARGKIHLDRETLDARKIVEAVSQDRMAQVHDRNLTLDVALPPDPIWIHADGVRLTQVLDNLVGNAIKFTDPPGRIHIALEAVEGFAVARVRDTGVGIRPEMLERLFDPFQQEAQELARAAGGLGLGLALAKSLVELHGGRITAHSAGPGAGAEFEIRLSLATAPAAAPRRPAQEEVAPRRILIVEDNVDAGRSLRDLLERLGHEARVAETGSEALDALATGSADVVLCDLGLPGMSGYEVARAVRARPAWRGILLVALTGYGQPEDRQRSAEAGFDAHLTKPVDVEALNAVLRQRRADGG